MKKILAVLLLGVIILSSFTPLPVTATPSASLEDWVDSDFGNRIKITFPSDTEISADVNAVPILLKFEGSDNVYWQNRGNDDANDSKFYGYPASGSGFGTTPTELDYEIIDYNESAYRYHVFVNVLHLEDGTDTGNYIYMYTDYTGSGDFDSPTDVWGATAKYIGHFVTDASDSSANGNDGNVSGATLEANSSYLGGACYSFDGDNDYISLGTIMQGLTTYTIITTAYFDSSGSGSYPQLISNRKTSAEAGTFTIFYNEVSGLYAGYVYDTVGRTPTKIANDDERVFIDYSWVSNTRHIIRVNNSGTGLSSAFGNTTLNGNETRLGTNADSGADFKGKIGYMWIFSDAKSDDWIKAVYNNQENYATFITVGSIETYPTV